MPEICLVTPRRMAACGCRKLLRNSFMASPSTPAEASALLYAATMGGVDVPEATARRWAALIRPGTTLVITDKPANAESYSAPGFTIMTGADS
jgi:hypothetical protein